MNFGFGAQSNFFYEHSNSNSWQRPSDYLDGAFGCNDYGVRSCRGWTVFHCIRAGCGGGNRSYRCTARVVDIQKIADATGR
jgi:hypothetical protein